MIAGCWIYNNYKQGITGWDTTNTSCVNPTITNNLIERNLTGIYLIQMSGVIDYNIVRDNFISGDSNSGAGMMFSGNASKPYINYNVVTGNYTGFFILNNAAPVLGTTDGGTNTGYNIIMHNIDLAGVDNSIYLQNSSANIQARNNYFAHSNTEDIAKTVYDRDKLPTLGTVNFSDFITGGVISGVYSIYDASVNNIWFNTKLFCVSSNDLVEPKIFNRSRNIYYKVIPSGVYLLYVNYSTNGIKRFSAYGGLNEPAPFKIIENEAVLGINLNFEQIPENSTKIVYGKSFLLDNKNVVPVSFYHNSDKYRTQLLYLYEEGDFLYYKGTKRVNTETAEWEDVFDSEPSTFLKIKNISLHDQWESVWAEVNIVRNIENRVHIDLLNNEDDVLMVSQRLFFTAGIGLSEQQVYETRNYNLQYRMVPEVVAIGNRLYDGVVPDLINGYRLPTLFQDTEIAYLLQNNQTGKPITLTIYKDGHLMWEPPGTRGVLVGFEMKNWDKYRIYKDNRLYIELDYRLTYHQVDPKDLEGAWFVVAFQSNFGEGAKSNVINYKQLNIDDDVVTTNFNISNYPNPFNPTTTVKFGIRNSEFGITPHLSGGEGRGEGYQNIQILIYNIKGQKVKTLVNGSYTAGEHSVVWDGTDDNGNRLGSGVYLYKMTAGDFTETRKMLLLK